MDDFGNAVLENFLDRVAARARDRQAQAVLLELKLATVENQVAVPIAPLWGRASDAFPADQRERRRASLGLEKRQRRGIAYPVNPGGRCGDHCQATERQS